LEIGFVFESFGITERLRIFNPKPAVVPERQAVKKPLFSNKIFKFHDTTIQIKPSEKALFLSTNLVW
jgi:hypothetical protein